jgi:hypothetical protein
MEPTSPPRRGFNFALILSVIGVILGGTALFLLLSGVYDPSQPFGIGSLSGPIGKYKMDTPEGAAKAEYEMRLNRDRRALTEYETRFDEAALKEKVESFKVEDQSDYKHEKAKDDKSKGKGSGEFKILFVSYKHDGETKKEVVVMEHYPDLKLWKKTTSVNSMEVEKANKDLAKKMTDWK